MRERGSIASNFNVENPLIFMGKTCSDECSDNEKNQFCFLMISDYARKTHLRSISSILLRSNVGLNCWRVERRLRRLPLPSSSLELSSTDPKSSTPST